MKVVVILVCFGVLICAVYFTNVNRVEDQTTIPKYLVTGDLILIESNTWRGSIVKLIDWDLRDFTHVGVVIKEEDETYVFHADPFGREETTGPFVNKEPIHDFLLDRSLVNYEIYRMSDVECGCNGG